MFYTIFRKQIFELIFERNYILVSHKKLKNYLNLQEDEKILLKKKKKT